jgi:hypothetical protein
MQATMSANFIGSASRSLPEWNGTENLTHGLLAEHLGLRPVAGQQAATGDHHVAKVSPALSIVDADQFARAIEEIELAAAALREGEPDLEPWVPDTGPTLEQQPPRSVWLFVGTIWIATVLATGAATLAITVLL